MCGAIAPNPCPPGGDETIPTTIMIPLLAILFRIRTRTVYPDVYTHA